MKKYVIAGDGAAGDAAAVKLRELDGSAEIHVFSAEEDSFYYRPRLIDYLAGSVTLEKITLHSADWYAEQNIRLHRSCAIVSADGGSRTVSDASGAKYGYDALLLACGAHSFIPSIEGLKDVRRAVLQTASDVRRIREMASRYRDAAVIGGGLLGLEAANSLLSLGCRVTVIDRSPWLLSRQLDEEAGKMLAAILSDRGLRIIPLGVSERAEPAGEGLRLYLRDGGAVEASFLLLSAGVRPNTEPAAALGISAEQGVEVNDFMETALSGVYAAGDVCRHRGAVYGTWMPARQQGETAAFNMAGIKRAYEGSLPSYKLKVAGVEMFSAGTVAETPESVVCRGEGGVYKRAFLQGGELVGALMLGDTSGEREVSAALAKGGDFESVRRFFTCRS